MSGWILRPSMLTDWATAGVHAQSFQKYVQMIWAADNRDTVVTGLPLWTLAALLIPPPLPTPPHQISSSFSSSSSFSGQHALSCALHHAHDGVIQREHSASAVCRCSVVLILCLSSSLPPLLPPFPSFSLFLTHTVLFTPLSPPLFSSFLSLFHHPLPPSLFLRLCFFPSGVQMTLLVIAVKPTLWPVSTVCQFPLLSLSVCPRVTRACWV